MSTPSPGASRISLAAAPYLFTAAFFAVWEGACRLFKVPAYFLPTPSIIAKAKV